MGWVKDPRNVELTYDEQMDAELSQVDIARFEQLKVAENAREAAASVRAAGIRTENSRANVARSKAPRRGPASA
jgi:hypothetical protein